MEINELFQPGEFYEEDFCVQDQHLASHLGSGSMGVLATPAMIAQMEHTALSLLAKKLPPGQTSVGTRVDIRHLAPTPLGMKVHVRAEILNIDGRFVEFNVQAWDEVEKVGEGVHLRAVINEARFLERVVAKGGG